MFVQPGCPSAAGTVPDSVRQWPETQLFQLSLRSIRMPSQDAFSHWKATVAAAFPHLSRPQATVLALWSYGMVLAKACGITLVSAALALQLGGKEASMAQRLREWCYDAADKKGSKRREVDVQTCFAPLLRWPLSWWSIQEPRLVLALDATTLSDRFTVLAISVLYRGCAIPVALKVVTAGAKGTWQPYQGRLCLVWRGGLF